MAFALVIKQPKKRRFSSNGILSCFFLQLLLVLPAVEAFDDKTKSSKREMHIYSLTLPKKLRKKLCSKFQTARLSKAGSRLTPTPQVIYRKVSWIGRRRWWSAESEVCWNINLNGFRGSSEYTVRKLDYWKIFHGTHRN